MFVRKHRSALEGTLQKQNIGREMDQQGVNHEFFLLVRDRKYQQALRLGQMYLRYHPQNVAVARFCAYIEKNKDKLLKMVDEEENYTDASSEQGQSGDSDDDSSDEDSSSQESEESEEQSRGSKIVSEKTNCSLPNIYANKRPSNQASRTSLVSILSKAPSQGSINKQSQLSMNKENLNGRYCRGHTWNHVCKNPNCPNKKKK